MEGEKRKVEELINSHENEERYPKRQRKQPLTFCDEFREEIDMVLAQEDDGVEGENLWVENKGEEEEEEVEEEDDEYESSFIDDDTLEEDEDYFEEEETEETETETETESEENNTNNILRRLVDNEGKNILRIVMDIMKESEEQEEQKLSEEK